MLQRFALTDIQHKSNNKIRFVIYYSDVVFFSFTRVLGRDILFSQSSTHFNGPDDRGTLRRFSMPSFFFSQLSYILVFLKSQSSQEFFARLKQMRHFSVTFFATTPDVDLSPTNSFPPTNLLFVLWGSLPWPRVRSRHFPVAYFASLPDAGSPSANYFPPQTLELEALQIYEFSSDPLKSLLNLPLPYFTTQHSHFQLQFKVFPIGHLTLDGLEKQWIRCVYLQKSPIDNSLFYGRNSVSLLSGSEAFRETTFTLAWLILELQIRHMIKKWDKNITQITQILQ